MRASHQDLIHAHSSATVAPSDLGDLYICATISLIKPPVDTINIKDVFRRGDHIILRTNKSFEELGLTTLGLQWEIWPSCYLSNCGYPIRDRTKMTTVYCRSTNLNAVRVNNVRKHIWLELMTLLDDDDYLVIKNNKKEYVIKLPQ